MPGVRHTEFSSIGMDPRTFSALGAYDERITSDIQDILKVIRNGAESPDMTMKEVAAIMPKFFNTMVRRFNDYYASQLWELDQAYAFAKEFETGVVRLKKPAYLDLERRFLKAVAPEKRKGIYRQMVSANPFLKRLMTGMFFQSLIANATFTSTRGDILFSELLEQISPSNTRNTVLGGLPSALTRDNGINFCKSVLSVAVAADSHYLNYQPAWESKPRIDELVKLLMFKLMIPYTCLNEAVATDIDNRIVQALLVYYKIRDNKVFSFDLIAAKRGQRNQLTDALDGDVFAFGRTVAETDRFLRTTYNGGGWSTTVSYATRPISATLSAVLGNPGIEATPFSSSINDEVETTIDSGK